MGVEQSTTSKTTTKKPKMKGKEIIEKYKNSRSPKYIRHMSFYWPKFLERMSLDELILQEDKKTIEKICDDYITWLIENNPKSVKAQFAPVQFVFEELDLNINWHRLKRRILKIIPYQVKPGRNVFLVHILPN